MCSPETGCEALKPVEKTTFTLSEAAELLSCHKETLRRAIKEGGLYAAKVGKGYRISRADLEEFWKAKGGGALFEGQARPPQPESVPSKKPERKPVGPEQLKLPT